MTWGTRMDYVRARRWSKLFKTYFEGVHNYITMKITEDTATPTACRGSPESKRVKEYREGCLG